MVVVHRDLPDRTREGDGQLARRVVVTEQHVGDGIAALGASEPGFQDGIGLFAFPGDRQRPAVHQHQYQRLASGFQGLDQLALAGRDLQGGAAGRLVRHAAGLADHRHHHIGLLRCLDRFIDQHSGRARIVNDFRGIEVEEVEVIDDRLVAGNVGAFGIDQLGLALDGAAQAFAHGDRVHRFAVGSPAAHHVDRRIGQRADQGNGAGFFQRQGLLAVFQQHQAAARHVARGVTVQAVFAVVILQVGFGLADPHVRVLEQAHFILGAQYFAHGLVQFGLGHLA